jgi:EpsD family peptidyl-prolyl cis-trans isomerase
LLFHAGESRPTFAAEVMKPFRFDPSIRVSLAACAALFVLGACGSGSKSASQVAVKVNSDEISVHQLNERLAHVSANGLTEDQKTQARKTVLDNLVEQELLVQQAKTKQLDRDPDVVSALEAARAQVLADAYVKKQILPNTHPSEAETQKYYDENPNLFAARRVYALQEATVPSMTNAQREELKKIVASGNLEDGLKWLKSQDVKATVDFGMRTAEQVPLAILGQLAVTRNGAIDFFEGPNGGARLIKVVLSQPAPMDFRTAHPAIEQYLANRKRDELVRSEIKRLRNSAKIQYVGEFEKLAQSDSPSAIGSPAPGAPESALTANGAKAETANASGNGSDAISKGLKGL